MGKKKYRKKQVKGAAEKVELEEELPEIGGLNLSLKWHLVVLASIYVILFALLGLYIKFVR